MDALSNGVMSFFALPLTAHERSALAVHISALDWEDEHNNYLSEALVECAVDVPIDSNAWANPHWSGWGVDAENTRYQRDEQARLSTADLDKLELKWAFGFPGSATIGSQPAVVGGRVFVGSPEHRLYALDAATGCTYWYHETRGGVRGVPVVTNGSAGPTVYATDRGGWVYAIDANTGALRWEHHVDPHPATMLTASPVLHNGRLYVTAASFEENSASARNYECCTFRGSVSAARCRNR